MTNRKPKLTFEAQDKVPNSQLKFPLNHSYRQPILKFTVNFDDLIDTDKTEEGADITITQGKPIESSSPIPEPKAEDKAAPDNHIDDEFGDEYDDDLLDELPSSSNFTRPKLRMERFLSIADIPDEIVQNLSRKYNSHVDDDHMLSIDNGSTFASSKSHPSSSDGGSPLKVYTEKSCDSRKSFVGYRDGSGIPQEKKVNIIRSILKDYNVETYIDKFTACDVTEMKLDS
jgi:hypothetical protein